MYLRCTKHNAIHYHVTVRGIGIIRQSGIHSANNVVTEPFIISNGLGKLFSLPEFRLVSHTVKLEVVRIKLIYPIITGENFNIRIFRIDLKIVNDLSIITFCIVQYHFGFRCAGRQIVRLLSDYLKIIT